MEDTERPKGRAQRHRIQRVTVGSIRWRILKVVDNYDTGLIAPAVTVGSIRWRILKGRADQVVGFHRLGYSGFDPMEDTESRRRFLWRRLGLVLQWVRSDGGY